VRLEDLGWNPFFASQLSSVDEPAFVPARVTEESKNFYRVRNQHGEYLAELAGALRHRTADPAVLPAVGDWVLITPRAENRARIERVLARRTKLSRKVAGRAFREQIVSANLDVVFVTIALNHDFNPRRIERYLSIVWESGARPVILLNKSDLRSPDEAAALAFETESIAPGVPVHLVSALDPGPAPHPRLQAIRTHLAPGETAAFIGSSGVGKSTLINALLGKAALATQPVRSSDDRGRHTTTRRQMLFLPVAAASGAEVGTAIVIDTPGMRELQLWNTAEGVAQTFDDIAALAARCKFRDCTHRGEPACAVEAAVASGSLDPARLENLRKLESELAFQQRKVDPAAAHETKEKWKKIHKAQRDSYRLRPK
jgi:ribosome biogenesis GTPase / thiamine phosphate phosphatase